MTYKKEIRFLLKQIEKELDYIPFADILDIIQIEDFMDYKLYSAMQEYQPEE